METILFLGGQLDGRIMSIPQGDRHYLHTYTTERLDATEFSLAPTPSDCQEIPYKTDQYTRAPFKVDGKVIEVMCHRDLGVLNGEQKHELSRFHWLKLKSAAAIAL